MKGGWVQAEDLYMIIIFFESIVKNTLENPINLVENPLEKNFISLLATLGWGQAHTYMGHAPSEKFCMVFPLK